MPDLGFASPAAKHHVPPFAAGTPRLFNSPAIALRVVNPACLTSAMTGARSAARSFAFCGSDCSTSDLTALTTQVELATVAA